MKSFCLESSQKFGSVHSVSTEAFILIVAHVCMYVYIIVRSLSYNIKRLESFWLRFSVLTSQNHKAEFEIYWSTLLGTFSLSRINWSFLKIANYDWRSSSFSVTNTWAPGTAFDLRVSTLSAEQGNCSADNDKNKKKKIKRLKSVNGNHNLFLWHTSPTGGSDYTYIQHQKYCLFSFAHKSLNSHS